jgi:hypothetical protein
MPFFLLKKRNIWLGSKVTYSIYQSKIICENGEMGGTWLDSEDGRGKKSFFPDPSNDILSISLYINIIC